MGIRIILLSGPVVSGKSALAAALANPPFNVHLVKTRLLIAALTNAPLERRALQDAGDALDRSTNGAWVARELTRIIAAQHLAESANNPDTWLLVDSVRIPSQIEHIRKSFGLKVVHVHLTAPPEELQRRYEERIAANREMAELDDYEDVKANSTEAKVHELGSLADLVINTVNNTKEDVVTRVAAQLGFYGRGFDRLVDVLIGGQYGSEGKGQIAAYLAPEYDVLVRVGGPNAGHQVYEEPLAVTYHHLPSGTTRNPNAKIVLGAGSVLRVDELIPEINNAHVTVDRLFVDEQAIIVSKEDIEAESRLVAAIGSTGSGVGAATARKVLREIADRPVTLAKDVPELKPYLRDTVSVLEEAFANGQRVLLEGTQGTGLSLHHGSYPYVTSRDTTVAGCLSEAGIPPGRLRRAIMVCRTFPIRVESPKGSTSGPMSLELKWQDISDRSGIDVAELRGSEKTSRTRKPRRIGEFDWKLIRRAASLNAPTDIALSFADYFSIENRKARRFEQLTTNTIHFISELERVTSAPVSLIATRFAFRSIIDRRAW
jgi:adenylosuccinate synthase